MSDEVNKEGFDGPASANADFNDDGFVFYVHQYHRRGVDEAYTGAGENAVIAERLNREKNRPFKWSYHDPPTSRTRFCYFTPTAVYYQSKSQLNLKLLARSLSIDYLLLHIK